MSARGVVPGWYEPRPRGKPGSARGPRAGLSGPLKPSFPNLPSPPLQIAGGTSFRRATENHTPAARAPQPGRAPVHGCRFPRPRGKRAWHEIVRRFETGMLPQELAAGAHPATPEGVSAPPTSRFGGNATRPSITASPSRAPTRLLPSSATTATPSAAASRFWSESHGRKSRAPPAWSLGLRRAEDSRALPTAVLPPPAARRLSASLSVARFHR